MNEQLPEMPTEVCDVEFSLPRPSYTIVTLHVLKQRYPGDEFLLLVGTDILERLPNWKSSQELLDNFGFLVYPRDGYSVKSRKGNFTYLNEAPRWNYSSTDIRNALRRGNDVSGMVCAGVVQYIKEKMLWTPQKK